MNRYVRLAGRMFLLSLALSDATAATQADLDAARAKALAYLVRSQKGAGHWSTLDGLETQTTAAVLEAMRNAGFSKGGSYSPGLAWLSNALPSSVEGVAKKITALRGAGRDVSPAFAQLMGLKNAADRYAWGAYAGFDTGFPETPLALSAIRATSGGYPDTDQLAISVYCEILPAQRTDGGWAYGKPASNVPAAVTAGAIIPTAHTLMELAAVKAATGWDSKTCGSAYSLAAALNNAKGWLLGKKNADGGFGDNGQSGILETALAYRAIQSVDPSNPVLAGAQDYLFTGAGKPKPNGSWADDPLQTALALGTLAPAMLPDTDQDGIPDAVQAILGTAAHNSMAGNGQGQAGLDKALLLATARINKPFSYTLSPVYPAPFGLASGNLPDGLAFNAAAGTISGTPTRLGVFNFSFTSAGKVQGAQISVTPLPYRLKVAYSGMGSVTDSLGAINCGAVCEQGYEGGETVTLIAGTPEPGYVFTGWSGDCSGTAATCTFTMGTDKTVTANFFSHPRSSWKLTLGQKP